MKHGLDFDKFNFPKIFSAVVATESLKRSQTRPLRSEIQEIAIAKYSGDQLGYCGDTEYGRDFFGKNNEMFYESKAMDGLFQKRTGKTAPITLKNFRGKCLGLPEKTFDYMILWDTKTMTVGVASWDACIKNLKIKDAVIEIRVDQSDIEFIARNVEPAPSEDFAVKLARLIEETI